MRRPCCCTRTCRRRRQAPRGARRGPTLALAGARLGAARRSRSSALEPLFPKQPRAPTSRVIDSHTHLDSCEPPNAELVAAAAGGGRATGSSPSAWTARRCRTALAAAEDFPQVYAAIGRHPNAAHGFDDADLAELRALAAHERCAAIGETGLDYFRDRAPREDQERAFRAQIELARETGKPLVIHTRAAEDDTIAHAARARRRPRRDPALLLDARAPRRVPRAAAGGSRSPATSPTRARATSPRPPSACPTTACSSRPTRRTSRPQAVRKERNQPAFVVAHRALRRRAPRRSPTRSSSAASSATRARLFGW